MTNITCPLDSDYSLSSTWKHPAHLSAQKMGTSAITGEVVRHPKNWLYLKVHAAEN